MPEKKLLSMTFTEILIMKSLNMKYEILTFEASKSWTSHDISTKIFVHAFHTILNNFVKTTFMEIINLEA